MKTCIYSLILVPLFFLYNTSYGQTDDLNHKKYWDYREKLRKHFVKIGRLEGQSICSANIDNNPLNHGAEVNGAVWPNTSVEYGYRRWGDALAMHGEYMAVLATEYRLLNDAGQSVAATLNELYYAINAVNRLDIFAERYFGQNNMTGQLNGFPARDDVPKLIAKQWQSQYGYTLDPHDRYEGVCSSTYLDEVNGAIRKDNEVSQDQLIRVLYGFAFIVKLVDNVHVKPTPQDMGFKLVDEAKAITDRIMKYLLEKKYFYIVISNLCIPSKHEIYKVFANWVLINPVTQDTVERGAYLQGLTYPFAKTAQYITGIPYETKFYWDFITGYASPCLVDLESALINADFYVEWKLLQNYTPSSAPTKYCMVFGWPLQNLKKCWNYEMKDYNVSNMLDLAVVSGSWTQDRVNAWATPFEMYPYDLSYSILHNKTPQRSAAFYRDVLNSAPCQGPYSLQDKDGNRSYDPEWNENSRWSHPFGPSNQTFGEYNGNDYMLLYNLYRLAFKAVPNLPPYQDNACPCTSSNYMLETASVNNVLNKQITLRRKFNDYTNFGIYLKEYLNHSHTISSSGNLILNTDFVVCNNSTLDISAFGTVTVGDGIQQCKLIIRKGSTLIIHNGGNLKVLDKSLVLIEPGATIIFQQTPKLAFTGDNSVLEVQGSMILDNATVDFSYASGNRGYFKFSQPGASTKNLSTKGSSSLNFAGYNDMDKVLEISQESLYIPAGLKFFNVKTAQVALHGNSRLSVPCPLSFDGSRLTSVSGGPNAHRGMEVYGQVGMRITNSIFENGGTGLTAILFYGTYPLVITNNRFQYNDAGLVTYGKGVSLQKCIFTKNQAFGWKADGLEYSSRVFACEFSYNSTSGIFLFSSPVKVDVLDCKMNNNDIGIITEGSSTLNVKCGEVKNNRKDGFMMMNNATLSMSTSLGGGYVNASGNGNQGGLTINMQGANKLYLDRGFNDLTLDAGQTSKCITNGIGCRTLIDGTLNLPPCNGNPIVPANYNVWDNLTPWYFSNQRLNSLTTSAVCTNNGVQPNIILTDQFPGSKALCDLYVPDPCAIDPGSCPTNFLATCNDCSTINTTSFSNVKLNKAVQTASGGMSSNQSSGYKKAISDFGEILQQPENDTKPQEKEVIHYGEKKMKESLASAVEFGQVPSTGIGAAEAQKTIAMLNSIINRAEKKGDYPRKLYNSVEKATIYRLLNRRDLAISLLDSISLWAEHDQKEYIAKWRCLMNAEEMILKKQVEKEDFESIVSSCNQFSYRKSITEEMSVGDLEENGGPKMLVTPNPSTDGSFNIKLSETSYESQWQISVNDILGNKVIETQMVRETSIDLSQHPHGIYFIKAENGEGSTLVVRVLFIGE